jgi:hypothetical protein
MGRVAGMVIGAIVALALAYFTGGASIAGYAAAFSAGATIGGAIGGALDPPPPVRTASPRLNDATQQLSSYGAPIPEIEGAVAVMGNIFWLEGNKLKEVATTTSQGGKGMGAPSAEHTSYKYFATFALGLCVGEVSDIGRIWFSGKLFYDATSTDEDTIIESRDRKKYFTFYTGSETQLPDDRMEADLGVANCPAFRGLCYVVFYDIDMSDYGNMLPGLQIKVELIKKTTGNYPFTVKNNIAIDDIRSLYTDSKYLYVGSNTYIDVYTLDDFPNFNRAGLVGFGNIANERVYGMYSYNGYLAISSDAASTAKYVTVVDVRNVEDDPITPILYKLQMNGTDIIPLSGFGSKVCYANHYSNVLTVALMDMTDASEIGSTDVITNIAYIYDIVYTGTHAYITYVNTSGQGKLLTVDTTNANSMVVTNQITLGTPSETTLVLADGNLVALNDRIQVYSLSNPDAPTAIGSGITVPAAYAWVHDTTYDPSSKLLSSIAYTKGILRVSLANPAIPVVASYDLIGSPGSTLLALQNTMMFVKHTISSSQYVYGVFVGTRIASDLPILGDIVKRAVLKSNLLTNADIDVSELTDTVRGYKYGQLGSIRSQIEPLQGAFPFDVIQDGYKIKCVKRGKSSVATIDVSKLDARQVNENPGAYITDSREMATIVPTKVAVRFLDYSREYEINDQYADRPVNDAVNEVTMEYPVVFTATEAAKLAQSLLYVYWLERHEYSFKLPPEYNYLQPCDVITVVTQTSSYSLRIVSLNFGASGVIEVAAKPNNPAVYVPEAVGQEGLVEALTILRQGTTTYELLDLPATLAETNTPGIYVAGTGKKAGWTGGLIALSTDNGASYKGVVALNAPGTIMGNATTSVGANNGFTISPESLAISVFTGTLYSITTEQMLAGGNTFAYGAPGRWEILSARNCTLVSGNNYILSDLLRGRFGTEQFTGTHLVGDKIINISTSSTPFVNGTSDGIGHEYLYKGISKGQSLTDVSARKFTYKGVNLKPLSPINPKFSYDPTDQGMPLSWTRRARVNTAWKDNIDVPVDELSEKYDIEIYQDAAYTTLVATHSSSSPTFRYTSAQRQADFGSLTSYYYVKVYQVSASVGRGYPLSFYAHP